LPRPDAPDRLPHRTTLDPHDPRSSRSTRQPPLTRTHHCRLHRPTPRLPAFPSPATPRPGPGPPPAHTQATHARTRPLDRNGGLDFLSLPRPDHSDCTIGRR
jgi:hypothetical protein